MKNRWLGIGAVGPIGLALVVSCMARAEDPTSTGVSPNTQSGTSPAQEITRETIEQLGNPFVWGGPPTKQGLLGAMTSQSSPQYPAPVGKEPAQGAPVPPTTMPEGLPTPPVPGAEPGAAAAPAGPVAEAAPAAPSPAAPTVPGAGDLFASAAGTAGPGFGGGLGAFSTSFPMIGDRGPLFLRQSLRFPPVPTPVPPPVPRPGNNPATLTGRSVAAIVPAVRGFKIADNQYPRPVDRVWVSFNYYDGVNSGLNQELGAPIKNMQVYNEVFGFEKTFFNQQASVGFRIPVNTLTITSGIPELNGEHTSTGNFSSFVKFLLWQNDRGSLLSAGLDMSFPTGPKSFAGYPTVLGINAYELQPFLGYILRWDNFYLQGFDSIVVPTDRNLATMYYCDIAMGYFVYRSQGSAGYPLGYRARVRNPPEHSAELGGIQSGNHRQHAGHCRPDLGSECRTCQSRCAHHRVRPSCHRAGAFHR